jgi:hypothetical protein
VTKEREEDTQNFFQKFFFKKKRKKTDSEQAAQIKNEKERGGKGQTLTKLGCPNLDGKGGGGGRGAVAARQ